MATLHGCCRPPTPMIRFLALLFLYSSSIICDSFALPIPAPDVRNCHLASYLPDGEAPMNCCAPKWNSPLVDFQPAPSTHSPLRVRRPAHAADQAYAHKLRRAYQLMQALPPEDPRSFIQQANIHCAYCNAAYSLGNTSKVYQIHASWLFFSFHRWYLYFHERILAKLLQDDTFAVPFWNYDHPSGSTIPSMYINDPVLGDKLRESSHQPPSVVMVDYYVYNTTIRTPEEQLEANAHTMYRMVVSGARTQTLFFGQPYRMGDDPRPGYGTIETMPHNSVHVWVGDSTQLGKKDMGSLYAAGRDPVFYAHHGNIDRIWEIWRGIDGNEDIDDPDYLDSEFVFYNEDAELVKVKVRDSFSTEKLGYVYEDVENVWMNARPSPLTKGQLVMGIPENGRLCEAGGGLLEEPCSAMVPRSREGYGGEEILVVEGIDVQVGSPARFDVFVNLPSADSYTMLNCTEYAGAFSSLPQITQGHSHHLRTTLRLGISFIVEELDLQRLQSLAVTIVPKNIPPYLPVSISSIRIEYELRSGKKKKHASAK